MRRALGSLVLAVLVGGCGNDRTAPPDLETPQPPRESRVVRIDAAKVRFRAPGNWPDLPGQGRRVGGVRSGRATVAVWSYPRTVPLPSSTQELRQVRDLLEERVKARDAGFDVRRSRVVRRASGRAIEIVGRGQVGGVPMDIRSTHLFRARTEVVVDAYAPPKDFARVDDTVFEPLLRSLRVGR